MKYFVVFWELCDFCCRLLPVSGCRLLVPPCLWGGWNILSNRKEQFYFYIYSCKSGSAGVFEFWKQSPNYPAECCVMLWCAHCPAVRTSALSGSPTAFWRGGWVQVTLALDMFPCPLSCFSGTVHAEDARSVVEASCASPALPSCWREIFRCCFASSSLYPKNHKERRAMWRD